MKGKNIQTFDLVFFVIITIMILLLAAMARAQTDTVPEEIKASGGTFTLEKTVTAGGGVNKTTSPLSENGTTGQTVAGGKSTGGNFMLYHGFWTPDIFAPTSANAVIGGRVSTADGSGIKNAAIIIIFPTGEMRTARSSSFGYYSFTDIPVGAAYSFSVSAKRYTFSQPTVIRTIEDDTRDINFIADTQSHLTKIE